MNTPRQVTRVAAVTFTLAPAVAGVIFFNFLNWTQNVLPRVFDRGGDDLFVVLVTLAAMVAGVAGACHGSYRFIRTGNSRQPGLWLLLVVGCLTAEVPGASLAVFPLSVGFDLRLESAHLGVNFLAAGLLIAYSYFASRRSSSPGG